MSARGNKGRSHQTGREKGTSSRVQEDAASVASEISYHSDVKACRYFRCAFLSSDILLTQPDSNIAPPDNRSEDDVPLVESVDSKIEDLLETLGEKRYAKWPSTACVINGQCYSATARVGALKQFCKLAKAHFLMDFIKTK